MMVYVKITIKNPQNNVGISGIPAKINTGALTLLSEKYAIIRIPEDIALKLGLNTEDYEEIDTMDFLRRQTKIRILKQKVLIKIDVEDRKTDFVESMVFLGPGIPLITYPLAAKLRIEVSPPRNAWKFQDETNWRPAEVPHQ